MDNDKDELSAELKLKLLQAETESDYDCVRKSRIIKSGITGSVAFGVFPLFGVFLMNTWQLIVSICVFSAAGGILFSLAAHYRNSKK